MALILEDPEVDRLAEKLSSMRGTSKAAAIRQALEKAIQDESPHALLIARGVEIGRELRVKSGVIHSDAADKTFIDSLYED